MPSSEPATLTGQKVSIVIASGDSGVAARGTDDGNSDGCLGTGNVFNPGAFTFSPFFPAAH